MRIPLRSSTVLLLVRLLYTIITSCRTALSWPLNSDGRESYGLHSLNPGKSGSSRTWQYQEWKLQEQEPGFVLAARQYLFSYAAKQGIGVLKDRITQLYIPPISKSFDLPVLKQFTLQLSDFKVNSFSAAPNQAQLVVSDGHFELFLEKVEAFVSFQWHWDKLGMSGTGTGDLTLKGGSVHYRFRVASTEAASPVIYFDNVTSSFTGIDWNIKSFSQDWFYRAAISLMFRSRIQQAVQDGVTSALQTNVPDLINNYISQIVPGKIDMEGLPFSAAFVYDIFTSSYMLVQGYSEVQSDLTSKSMKFKAMNECPYGTSPLPLTSEQIVSDGHMMSVYLHQSLINCMLWGLFNSDVLRSSAAPSIAGRDESTRALTTLGSALSGALPHISLHVDVELTAAPRVMFVADKGTVVQAWYRIILTPANATADAPVLATLQGNATITGQVYYDSTVLSSVDIHHVVEEAAVPINPSMWDNTIAWFIQNYAGQYPVKYLVQQYMPAYITSLIDLRNTASGSYDGWYVLSGDLQMD